MNLMRRNMLTAFVLGVFGWLLRPLLGRASSKTLSKSELVRINPYPGNLANLSGPRRIRYTAIHRRQDMRLLAMEIDVGGVLTRPTPQAYAYFAACKLYGFMSVDAQLAADAVYYFPPFRVGCHRNQFTLDLTDPHELQRFYELDLIFQLTESEAQEWFDLARTVNSFYDPHYLTATHAAPRKAWLDAQIRNPQAFTGHGK